MIHLDKLGRTIKIGDIVATTDGYTTDICVGKVYKITRKTVSFTLYRPTPNNTSPYSYYNPRSLLTMEDLKKEPTSWRRWTNASRKKLLILKRT